MFRDRFFGVDIRSSKNPLDPHPPSPPRQHFVMFLCKHVIVMLFGALAANVDLAKGVTHI